MQLCTLVLLPWCSILIDPRLVLLWGSHPGKCRFSFQNLCMYQFDFWVVAHSLSLWTIMCKWPCYGEQVQDIITTLYVAFFFFLFLFFYSNTVFCCHHSCSYSADSDVYTSEFYFVVLSVRTVRLRVKVDFLQHHMYD